MTLAPTTKLGRVLAGLVRGETPCRTVAEVEGTVALYRGAQGGLTPEEARDVAHIKAEIGRAEAGRAGR